MSEAVMEPEDLDTRTLVLLLAKQLHERVRTHPASTLLGAASVGYMLGFSMPTPFYRIVASLALRSVAMQVIGDVLDLEPDDVDGRFGLEEDDLDLGQARRAAGPYVT
jgi:hypothetical protein